MAEQVSQAAGTAGEEAPGEPSAHGDGAGPGIVPEGRFAEEKVTRLRTGDTADAGGAPEPLQPERAQPAADASAGRLSLDPPMVGGVAAGTVLILISWVGVGIAAGLSSFSCVLRSGRLRRVCRGLGRYRWAVSDRVVPQRKPVLRPGPVGG